MGVFRKIPGQRMRRGLLGLQQFLDPGAAHVIEALDKQVVEDEEGGGGDPLDRESLRAELAAALRRSPIDVDDVRRVLTLARDGALDTRGLFDEVLAAEIAERPYRAPHLPIWSRVAPAEAG
jgi:hypothetical protein